MPSLALKIQNDIRAIENGLPVSAVEQLSKRTLITLDKVRSLARISTTSYERRKKSGTLSAEESDRLFRLRNITDKAIRFFEGDNAAAYRWMTTPTRAFRGTPPLDLLINEAGVREVEALLGRLEHGIFS